MKLDYKTRKVKLPFVNKKAREIRYSPKVVHGCSQIVEDLTGDKYQLFLQDDLEHVVDIRVNNPNVGVIIKGVFMAICRYEQYRDNGPVTDRIKETNLVDLFSELVSRYDEVE